MGLCTKNQLRLSAAQILDTVNIEADKRMLYFKK